MFIEKERRRRRSTSAGDPRRHQQFRSIDSSRILSFTGRPSPLSPSSSPFLPLLVNKLGGVASSCRSILPASPEAYFESLQGHTCLFYRISASLPLLLPAPQNLIIAPSSPQLTPSSLSPPAFHMCHMCLISLSR